MIANHAYLQPTNIRSTSSSEPSDYYLHTAFSQKPTTKLLYTILNHYLDFSLFCNQFPKCIYILHTYCAKNSALQFCVDERTFFVSKLLPSPRNTPLKEKVIRCTMNLHEKAFGPLNSLFDH